MDGVVLAGEPALPLLPALHNLILTELVPDAAARQVPFFTLLAAQPSWHASLPALLPRQQLEGVTRLAFSLPPGSALAASPNLSGPMLEPLDAPFLARRDLSNIDGPVGWVRSFWKDDLQFTREGVGFAILDGNTVASWALSVYAGDAALELGVETAAPYRGRGLATIAATACLQACSVRRLTPHWQCDATNEPSCRLATRLGFTLARRFQALRFWFGKHPQD